MTVRTRFAPSPTGRLHLGNVRAAVFNWLFARHHGGAFVLRIEDTDVGRNVEGGEEGIEEDLRWLGLSWDEGPKVGGPHGPYHQSARAEIHDEAVERLLAAGAAYPCFCTDADLAADVVEDAEGKEVFRYSGRCRHLTPAQREERDASGHRPVVRFAVPEGLTDVEIKDEVFGIISFPVSDIEDFVIRRSDGRVTYNFGVVVDDVDMEITHVIRGAGHLSNTPKQALLFDALEQPRPTFAHLPTVLSPEGGKLSKRAGATSVSQLREEGFPPEAVLNYVSLLGWSHPEEKEILTPEELIASVDLGRVGKSDPRVDDEKLRWVAGQHVAAEPLDALAAHVAPFVDEERYPSVKEHLTEVVDVLRTRLDTYGSINEHLSLLYPEDQATLEAARAGVRNDGDARGVLAAVRSALATVEPWNPETTGAAVRTTGKEVGARGRGLFHPIRLALTGLEKGPDLGKVLAALGREQTLRRLDATLEEPRV